MKKKISFTVVFVLMSMALFAQDKPGWIYSKPKPSNNTYLYVVESATGSTELEARNQTFARVLQSTAMRLGQPINSDEINKAVQSGQSFEVISSQYNIPINKVCEYTEKTKEGYRIYVLCQVAKSGNAFADFDYGFSGCYDAKGYKDGTALLLSAFIPGSGQMSKRRYGEGIITLLAEMGFGAGAIVSYVFAEEKELQIENYNNTGEVPYYYQHYYDAHWDLTEQISELKAYRTIEYSCLGVFAGVYIFNLYRAYTAKPKYKNSFALVPTAIPVGSDMAYGVSFTYKF